MESTINDSESRMKSSIKSLEEDLSGIRTGRATPALVDKLTVDYYGVITPFSQVSTITIPEPRSILIRPFDPSLINAMTKSIQASELGLNPSSDGKQIRLMLPPLTEERRKDLMKLVNNRLEECRIAIRNIRRDGKDEIKEAEKAKLISEDDEKKADERLQKVTDEYIVKVDEVGKRKEKEIMEV